MPGLVKPVHLIGDFLVWPVVFLYPEYKTSDMIQEFNETTMSVFYFYLYFLHLNLCYILIFKRPKYPIKFTKIVLSIIFIICNFFSLI